jgi:hypothetical protein
MALILKSVAEFVILLKAGNWILQYIHLTITLLLCSLPANTPGLVADNVTQAWFSGMQEQIVFLVIPINTREVWDLNATVVIQLFPGW